MAPKNKKLRIIVRDGNKIERSCVTMSELVKIIKGR